MESDGSSYTAPQRAAGPQDEESVPCVLYRMQGADSLGDWEHGDFYDMNLVHVPSLDLTFELRHRTLVPAAGAAPPERDPVPDDPEAGYCVRVGARDIPAAVCQAAVDLLDAQRRLRACYERVAGLFPVTEPCAKKNRTNVGG